MSRAKHRTAAIFLSAVMVLGVNSANLCAEPLSGVDTNNDKTQGFYNSSNTELELIARYNANAISEDGGSAEIVSYNSDCNCFYTVNGVKGTLDVVSATSLSSNTDEVQNLSGKEINISALLTAEDGFVYGDMTSVAVDTNTKTVAVAIQHADYSQNGKVAVFSYDDLGELTLKALVDAGCQPDMITYTKSGSKILVANEGEPREGYAEGSVDPQGSVTIIDTTAYTGVNADFTAFDTKRDELVGENVILKKNTNPSVDLEPEYIAVNTAGTRAYVALQEANAIAVLDLSTNSFIDVFSLGFKDHSIEGNELDLIKEKQIGIKNENVYGIYMPDGISIYEDNGITYVLTANEGDSRDWNGYINEFESKTSPNGTQTAEKVVYFDTSDYDGLDSTKDYIFGGRSFSMYQIADNSMTQVYDSGSDFENITAENIPEYFNCSNNKTTVDNRSGKKGPEPESVVVGTVGEKNYAFIALERIGGIMVYDITNTDSVEFVNYINSRDFSADISGDVSPEGLCFVEADKNPTGNPVLLSACEVSGTVAAYAVYEDCYNINIAPGDNVATSLGFNWYTDEADENSNTALELLGSDIVYGSFGVDDRTGEGSADTGGNPPTPPQGGVTPASTEGGIQSIWHKAKLDNLTPATTYTYRVKGEGEWSRWYNVTTDDGDGNVDFIFTADAQIGAGKDGIDSDALGWQNTVTKAMQTVPTASFILHGGDQIDDYSPAKEEYDGYLSPSELTGIPLATATGNHEVERNAQENAKVAYLNHFNISNISDNTTLDSANILNYWFRAGDAVIVVLDNSGAASAEVAETFRAKIQEAKAQNPDAKWVFASFHKSLYSVASHTPNEEDIANWREVMLPILDEEEVDVVLGGHDHIYVRTYHMLNDTATTNSVDNATEVTNPTGTMYLTSSSASGSKFYGVNQKNDLPEEQMNAYTAVYSDHQLPSFVKVSVENDTLTFTNYEIATDTIEIQDSYKITKTASTAIDGDYDNDGAITASDAANVLQMVLSSGSGNTEIDNTKLDVDNDGLLTSNDSAYILQKSLNNGFDYK